MQHPCQVIDRLEGPKIAITAIPVLGHGNALVCLQLFNSGDFHHFGAIINQAIFNSLSLLKNK